MEIVNFKPTTVDFTTAYLEWGISDTIEDLDDYVTVLYRGLVQTELEEIDVLDTDTMLYEDVTISGIQYDKTSTLYYQVSLHNILDNSKSVFSEIKRLNKPEVGWVLLEIARRDKIGLENVLKSQFTLLKLKHTGTLCSCYDETLGRKGIPGDCLVCYNTNYVGGYYYPYRIYGTLGAWGENVSISPSGGQKEAITGFLTTFFPELNVNDVIVDALNNRWRVVAYATSRSDSSIVKQRVQVAMVDRNDPVYQLPVRPEDMIIPHPGTVYDQSTIDLLSRMEVQPSIETKLVINQKVIDLKTGGVWDKLIALYIMDAHTSQAATLNWKSNNYTLIRVNSPFFDGGFYGDGYTSYLSTGYIPSGTNLCIGIKSVSNVDDNSTDFGNRLLNLSARKNNLLTFNPSSETSYAEINGDSTGFFILSIDSGIGDIYKNNLLINSINISNISYSNEPLFISAMNNTGPVQFSIRKYTVAFISLPLTQAEIEILEDILN